MLERQSVMAHTSGASLARQPVLQLGKSSSLETSGVPSHELQPAQCWLWFGVAFGTLRMAGNIDAAKCG